MGNEVYLRISPYTLAHGNDGISVSADERRKNVSLDELRALARERVSSTLLLYQTLEELDALANPKSSGTDLDFRADDLVDPKKRAAVISGVKDAVSERFGEDESLAAEEKVLAAIDLASSRIVRILAADPERRLATTIAEVLSLDRRS